MERRPARNPHVVRIISIYELHELLRTTAVDNVNCNGHRDAHRFAVYIDKTKRSLYVFAYRDLIFLSVFVAELSHQLFVEFDRCVEAHLFLTVVHCGNFDNYSQVSTGTYGYCY